ncbi:MAG: nucleoside-triphosphatase [Acetivibrio sp.]
MENEKHLFLKGNSGIGKTSLLLRCIRPYQDKIGGYLTQRLVNEKRETVGFTIVPIEEPLRPTRLYEENIPNVFIRKMELGFVKNQELFLKESVKLLNQAVKQKKELILLDELGGIELSDLKFKKKLYEVLKGEIPCMGVLKNYGNYKAMKERIKINPMVDFARMELEEDMQSILKCKILDLTEDNYFEREQEIQCFLQNQMGGKSKFE